MSDEQKTVSRREVIKAGGLVALGLSYSKPAVRMVNAKPAFQTYGGDGTWDRSSIEVLVSMSSCTKDQNVTFEITNTGDPGGGDMSSARDYRVYRDDVESPTEGGTFQLTGKSSTYITVDFDKTINGTLYTTQKVRLEADQHPLHPGPKNKPLNTPKESVTRNCKIG